MFKSFKLFDLFLGGLLDSRDHTFERLLGLTYQAVYFEEDVVSIAQVRVLQGHVHGFVMLLITPNLLVAPAHSKKVSVRFRFRIVLSA